jgi:hypothetical protein
MPRKIVSLALAAAVLGLLGVAVKVFAADDAVVIEAGEGSCHKVCRPVTDTRKVPKRVYTDVCEDFCPAKCGLFGCFSGHKQCDEEGAGCAGQCGHVRTRKYLVVKIQQKEECFTKCVVEQQACAVNHACPANVEPHARPAQAVTLQPVPVLPVPMPAPKVPVQQSRSPYAR